MKAPLFVNSHVGRDLLQTSQVFKTERTVIWEYVANSLQYHEEAIPPEVFVRIDTKGRTISIRDNGRGMDREGLAHFFTMHGENQERKDGRIGRGQFGTGKSAAFGIADRLVVSSVRGGLKNSVSLTREAIQSVDDGSGIPLDELESDVPTNDPNGTEITISEVHLKRMDRESVIQYIERKLPPYQHDIAVYIGTHKCEFHEPEINEKHELVMSSEELKVLGDGKATIKVAKSPLDPASRGIQIFSHGNWLASTEAGLEGREMADYIFGEAEIPSLEEYEGPIKPIDNTRSGELNGESEIVQALYRFLSPKLDEIRRELVDRKRKAAQSERNKQLAEEAREIAELLSSDFADFRLNLLQMHSGLTKQALPSDTVEGQGTWVEGGMSLADFIESYVPGINNHDQSGENGPDLPKPVRPKEDGNTTGKQEPNPKRKQVGGVDVEYQTLGLVEHRARFLPEHGMIVINLDHPQLAKSLEESDGGLDGTSFKKLSREVAFTEYAIALARMREEVGHYVDAQEPLFDIRETIDRLNRPLTS